MHRFCNNRCLSGIMLLPTVLCEGFLGGRSAAIWMTFQSRVLCFWSEERHTGRGRKTKQSIFLLIFFNERLSCGFPAHQNFSRDFCRLRPCVYSENVFEQLLRKTRCVAVWPSMEISPCARKDWNLIYTWLICYNSTREKTKDKKKPPRRKSVLLIRLNAFRLIFC